MNLQLQLVTRLTGFTLHTIINYNKENFQSNLQNHLWEDFDNANTVSDKWKILLDKITFEIDKVCPLRTFKIKQQKEIWISPDLIELIKDKDRALKLAKKRRDPDLWTEAKRLRNTCTRRLRQARADFISDNLNNNIGNQKKFWKTIQNLLPNKKMGNSDIHLVNDTTMSEIKEEGTAEYINDYFINIGPNLASKCNIPWRYTGKYMNATMVNITTDSEEITLLCKNININKSSCITNISSEILRDAFLALPDKIVDMFNMSFELGEIPDVWKIGKVTPLQKAGNKSSVSNLRPISLLPLVSKLIEKIVHQRIYSFCEDNNILDKRQGGFRPNHSTVSTTAFFIDDIYTAMNNDKATISVFIDAMKAFDTVNHYILLKKVHAMGLRGNVEKWLKNYLTNRKQCTVANNIVSDLKNITCGVPQGSVCGPLLFLLYINDLPKILNYSQVSLYADDTVIYISNSDVNLAANLLQHDLNSLQNWCEMNKLTINCKKTKYCVYGMRSIVKKSKTQRLVLSLNNQILDKVCSYKYLGFALDEHLNFNKHVTELKHLISHKLYLLSKIRRYITVEASINIFKTMILSVIEYGDIIYNGTSDSNLNDIEKLFYRGLRICINADNQMAKPHLCTTCKISTLARRQSCHLLLFMHKQKGNETLLQRKQEILDCMRRQFLVPINPIMKKLKKMYCIEALSNGMSWILIPVTLILKTLNVSKKSS